MAYQTEDERMKLPSLLKIAIIAFGLFIAYQLLRIIFGGSWGAEATLIAAVVLNVSMTFGLVKEVTKLKADMTHLNRNVYNMSSDMKQLSEDVKELKINYKNMSEDIKELKEDFKLCKKECRKSD